MAIWRTLWAENQGAGTPLGGILALTAMYVERPEGLQASVKREVRPFEPPVPRDVRRDYGLDAALREASAEVEPVEPGVLFPPVGPHPALQQVDAHGDALPEPLQVLDSSESTWRPMVA